MTKHNRRGLAICYTAIFLLSLNGLFSNSIALDAVSISQLRSVIAAFTLIAFCILTKRQFSLASKEIIIVYGIGILMGLHWATFFHSMQISSIAVGMLAIYTFPLITVLLEPLFNGSRLKQSDLIAAVVVLMGIGVMAYDELGTENKSMLLGIAWGVLSALFFSLRNLIQKYHLSHVSSDSSMFHQLVAVALLFILFVDYPSVLILSSKDIGLLILLGIVTTAGAHTLLVVSLKMLPVKTVAMLGCMQPMLGALAGWLVLGEKITYYIMIGGAIIVSVALYESIKSNKET